MIPSVMYVSPYKSVLGFSVFVYLYVFVLHCILFCCVLGDVFCLATPLTQRVEARTTNADKSFIYQIYPYRKPGTLLLRSTDVPNGNPMEAFVHANEEGTLNVIYFYLHWFCSLTVVSTMKKDTTKSPQR